MKKNLLIFALIITNVFISFSQVTKCDLVIKENQELKQQNDYLRKSLQIFEPMKIVENDDVEIRLVKCDGKTKEQLIIMTFVLINHKANDSFTFFRSQMIDIQGNDFSANEINLGNSYRSNTLYTDTPMQAKIVFNKVLPSTKILKLINLDTQKGNYEFKDIEVNSK